MIYMRRFFFGLVYNVILKISVVTSLSLDCCAKYLCQDFKSMSLISCDIVPILQYRGTKCNIAVNPFVLVLFLACTVLPRRKRLSELRRKRNCISYANNKYADQTAHVRSLISDIVFR